MYIHVLLIQITLLAYDTLVIKLAAFYHLESPLHSKMNPMKIASSVFPVNGVTIIGLCEEVNAFVMYITQGNELATACMIILSHHVHSIIIIIIIILFKVGNLHS